MSYTTCPSCGGSDGQGCYSYCPLMLQTRVMELERQIEEYYLPLIAPRHHEGMGKSVAALEARMKELEAEMRRVKGLLRYTDCSTGREEAEAVVLRRVKALEEALQWIDQQRYTDRNTINLDNAFEQWTRLNADLVMIMDKARAVLNHTTQQENTND